MLSRKSFLQLLGLASVSVGAQEFDLGKEAVALQYVRQVNTAQVTYHSRNGRYTERIQELISVAKLPETPDGWRLTISVHDNKWDVMLLQESMDAVIFVTDQTGMIRRGMMFPVRSLGYPAPPPSA